MTKLEFERQQREKAVTRALAMVEAARLRDYGMSDNTAVTFTEALADLQLLAWHEGISAGLDLLDAARKP